MTQTVVVDGRRIDVPPTVPLQHFVTRDESAAPAPPPAAARDFGPTELAPLGALFGARSGDKGGDANLGVWATSGDDYAWLAQELTSDRLRELLPETAPLEIDRYELPNIRAVNFVVRGLLGEGVAASTRPDPQAQSLGELLRAQEVELPLELLGQH